MVFLFLVQNVSGKKIKVSELIERHMQALGESPRQENRVARGLGTLDIRVGGTGRLSGPAILVFDGVKMCFDIQFGHVQYSGERFIYNGEKLDVGYIAPGIRSQLGQSLWSHFHQIIPEGLYGGVLSTAWSLLDVAERRPKLKYKGLKTYHKTKMHRLEYKPRKGVDYRIDLYFEPVTFRHLLSTYRLILPDGRIRPIETFGRGATDRAPRSFGDRREMASDFPESRDRVTIEERFSNFKETDGMILPHAYRVTVNFDQFSGSFVGHWEMKFNQILHNQSIDSQTFSPN